MHRLDVRESEELPRFSRGASYSTSLSSRELSDRYGVEVIAAGCAAVHGLVALWAEPEHVRSKRDPRKMREYRLVARYFRNTLDNIIIDQELEERARRSRTADVINFSDFALRTARTQPEDGGDDIFA